MSVIQPVDDHVGTQTRVSTWASISDTDTCQSVRSPSAAEKSVQFTGNFASGSISFEGSIDGTNYETMKDVENNDVTLTAKAIVTIRDNVQYCRPTTPTGVGASITVSILHKQVN